MNGFLGTIILALALPLSSFALTDESAIQTYHSQSIHLACGATPDVWEYISVAMGKSVQESVVPVISDEDARYFVEYEDGSWLISVEFVSLHPSAVPNFMCIVAKGEKDRATESINLPINALTMPHEIIGPGRSLKRNPQFTMSR